MIFSPHSPRPGDLDLQEERAGILEFEAGFTRAEAEKRSGLIPSESGGAHD